MSLYENQRVHFNKIVEMYLDYVRLYKFFNNGSIVGKTPFAQFYISQTFHAKYMIEDYQSG